jgi:hypothetical protein
MMCYSEANSCRASCNITCATDHDCNNCRQRFGITIIYVIRPNRNIDDLSVFERPKQVYEKPKNDKIPDRVFVPAVINRRLSQLRRMHDR